jgi:cytosine deaminase
MLIDRITAANVAGRSGTRDVSLADGRVREVAESPGDGSPVDDERSGTTLRAGGRALVPALVDAHVHLDKAFLRAIAEETGPLAPNLDAAIASVAALRTRLSAELVRQHAERAVDTLVRHGITAARVHVEIDSAVGLALVHLHRGLAAAVAGRIALELVAFPQRGLEPSGMRDLFAAAMAEGLSVVGGCPYVDTDPRGHLDLVFALAERHGAPVDLHLDFSDDVGRSLLGLVVERTRAHAMSGRVTIGHVTTLAAMAPDAQARALAALAEAGIALVVVPATDLYLAGHGEPGTRSLAPWERAAEAGVRVAIANNNIDNPFAPFGNGNLLQAAWLAGLTRRAVTPDRRRLLFEAVTSGPAAILGLPPHGPVVGSAAHLALIDTRHAEDAVLCAPAVLATLRAGRLVYAAKGPEVRRGEVHLAASRERARLRKT